MSALRLIDCPTHADGPVTTAEDLKQFWRTICGDQRPTLYQLDQLAAHMRAQTALAPGAERVIWWAASQAQRDLLDLVKRKAAKRRLGPDRAEVAHGALLGELPALYAAWDPEDPEEETFRGKVASKADALLRQEQRQDHRQADPARTGELQGTLGPPEEAYEVLEKLAQRRFLWYLYGSPVLEKRKHRFLNFKGDKAVKEFAPLAAALEGQSRRDMARWNQPKRGTWDEVEPPKSELTWWGNAVQTAKAKVAKAKAASKTHQRVYDEIFAALVRASR